MAIVRDKRDKGYGTKAIELLKELFSNSTLALSVEKPDDEDKKRRIEFYRKSGFLVADFQFECWGEEYYFMFNGKYEKENFIIYLLECFPDSKNFKEIK